MGALDGAALVEMAGGLATVLRFVHMNTPKTITTSASTPSHNPLLDVARSRKLGVRGVPALSV